MNVRVTAAHIRRMVVLVREESTSGESPSRPAESPGPIAGQFPEGLAAPGGGGPVPMPAAPDDDGPPRRRGPMPALVVGAIGVVFGDIGTIPLYSLQTVFSLEHNAVAPNETDTLGVISMVLWALTIIVSYKYVALGMRADNDGEGGILALVALLRDRLARRARLSAAALILGMVGAALFFGDSVITPAISVMSAIAGLHVVNPAAESLVLPASVLVLTILFAVQHAGTGRVGRIFGPVMILWFGALAVLGIRWIMRYPDILRAISPHYALAFAAERPAIAFIAMGAVVLAITGAEALYADMGHFGPRPIRVGWFMLVFPALALNYLGQGAMILHDPSTIRNPFFLLAPQWATLPLVVLATVATVIASQAVISGAFSMARQASRLGLLPRLDVRHTSREAGGQIYIGSINWLLYAGVLVLIAVFGSSVRLASAYGLAVTGTLILTSLLFLMLSIYVWRTAPLKLAIYIAVVGLVELSFFGATMLKFVSGGWLPVLIAGVVVLVMTTWRWGAARVARHRAEIEGPLDEFVEAVRAIDVTRVPGLAVYLHPDRITTPLALRTNLRLTTCSTNMW